MTETAREAVNSLLQVDRSRLAACFTCGSLVRQLRTVLIIQRERDGLERPKYIGSVPVYTTLCDRCENDYAANTTLEASDD